ncbi:MAG: surface carbohydrate biosynthesis protein [Pseudobdellovibrionaceae bacterium]
MSQKKIVIVVDNPNRDLPACSLLAVQLSQKYQVYLIPVSQAPFEIFRIQPDLAILNYLRVTNLKMVQQMIVTGIAFAILDTEGGVFAKIPDSNDTTYTKTIISDKNTRDQLQLYFAWGQVLFSDLKNRSIYPESSLFCTGTPRTDFYHPSFAPYFLTDKKVLLDKENKNLRKLVLINTSFSTNNPKFSNREKEARMLIEQFNFPDDYTYKLFDDLDQVMQEFIKLAQFLATNMPDVDFVLRPHPFEGLDVYEKNLQGYANLRVDSSDVVARWIWESSALIHYECSTALEAAFAGRPALSLAAYKEIRPNADIGKITRYVNSFSEMKNVLHEVLEGKYQNPPNIERQLKSIENDIYYKVDGQSYQRIASVIDEWLAKKNNPPITELKDPKKALPMAVLSYLFKSSLQFYFLCFYTIRSIIKYIVKRRLVPPAKSFSSPQVQNILDKILKVNFIKTLARQPLLSTAIEVSVNK